MTDYVKNEHGVLVGKGGVTQAGWHSVEAILRCQKEYQFKHVRKIKKPESETKEAFAIGLIVHAGRGTWLANRCATNDKVWQQIKEAAKRECELQKLPITPKGEQYGLRYVTEYIEHWSRFPKPRALAVEHLVGPAPFAEGDPFYLYRTARLDDVSVYAEAGNALSIGELKTTSATVAEVTKTYELHGQPIIQHLLYRLSEVGRQLLGPVTGTVLDVVQKGYGKEKSKFGRVFVTASDHVVGWYVPSMQHHLRLAAGMEWDSTPPRNISACTRAVSGRAVSCEYKELCMYGASATGKYVMGEGQSLKSWKPGPGKTQAPWS